MARPDEPIQPDETLEPFGQGRLWVIQKKQGYRFSLDAVLLSGLTDLREPEKVVDLGAGCGILALLLACRFPNSSFVGVELQPSLAALAVRNVRLNGFEGRIEIVQSDMQSLLQLYPPSSFEVVVSNPPYRPLASGRLNPAAERAIARHELQGSLELTARISQHLLGYGGRLYLIYPARRLVHLCRGLRLHRLEPKKMRLIHSLPGEEASLVWIEARKGGREDLKVLPPLVIYRGPGHYSPEMEKIFAYWSRFAENCPYACKY
ncbi:Methyltransferase type 11 [Desulfobacca acetoxidans DSM 11109]|uniref:Methyltransferase type 11 n=1 Tax=Desulfobacca acetoxidans (strain ATCC 700848 / DSM 11109 / ASRB2) TaxID=880072 RepID=F2NGL2_DESAR|nr:Methyltransferase type 11 [Desulfobacca acetoxidans DSM 11109]